MKYKNVTLDVQTVTDVRLLKISVGGRQNTPQMQKWCCACLVNKNRLGSIPGCGSMRNKNASNQSGGWISKNASNQSGGWWD